MTFHDCAYVFCAAGFVTSAIGWLNGWPESFLTELAAAATFTAATKLADKYCS